MASWTDVIDLLASKTPISAEIRDKVLDVLKAVQLAKPDDAQGLADEDFSEIGGKCDLMPARGVLKRALKLAAGEPEAKRARADDASSPGRSGLAPGVHAKAAELLGSEVSALEIAEQLGASAPVDVSQLLAASKLDKVPQVGLVSASVFQLLHTTKAQADKNKKVPFVFVDITARDVIPEWITPEAIGGKLQLPGADVSNGAMCSSTLFQMANALKSATSTPRYFRSMQQWTACWIRYTISAVTCDHISMAAALGHMQTVQRVSEEARVTNAHHVALAVTYDELVRKGWEARAQRHDSSLNIDAEAWKLNLETLETARSRLEQVVTQAGLKSGAGGAAKLTPATNDTAVQEAVLAKQSAAGEAVIRKMEAALQRLDKIQIPPSPPNHNDWRWKPKKQRDKEKADKGKGKGKGKGK